MGTRQCATLVFSKYNGLPCTYCDQTSKQTLSQSVRYFRF